MKSENNYKICSLSRFSLKDEYLMQEKYIKAEVKEAFDKKRSYSFFPDINIITELQNDKSFEHVEEKLVNLKNQIFREISQDNISLFNKLVNDARLSRRIIYSIYFVHKALSELKNLSMYKRRFVLIKERPAKPTIYHISNETTIISHIGQGPIWQEIPSIYLGLKIFDVLNKEAKINQSKLYENFKMLLVVQERAIETGYNHIEVYPAEFSKALNELLDAVIAFSVQYKIDDVEEPVKKVEKFTEENRKKILKNLNARLKYNDSEFDYNKCVNAIKTLEKLSRRYKKNNNKDSLNEIIELLVSASGHDLHEIRNKANIVLERIFSLKEYDAPLATEFYNIQVNENFSFKIKLPFNKSGFVIRIYNNSKESLIFTESDINYKEYNLKYNVINNQYETELNFNNYGHYDYVVLNKKQKTKEWLRENKTSGRINVMPNIKGEIILEVFVDIFGHTKVYWGDKEGHPGLVYNENGEVIRLGQLSDLAKHLPDLKDKYNISSLYLLGVQKRGENKEDWAVGASSASPFSPVSLTEIEPAIGGEDQFKILVKQAHKYDIKVIVDCIPHLNRQSKELSDENVVFCYDSSGNLTARASTDGRYGTWNDGKLLNYRRFEVWEWMRKSIETLIEKYDIDGIRFDSAHAVPIMMKKNNYQFIYSKKRTDQEMVEGRIILNDQFDDHFVTTGYYDCACRDIIAIPFHNYLMLNIERCIKKNKKDFFINIAECFWGHERFLARSGIVPYNASLFKVCENILHGTTDVREIYHLYDNYYPSVLPYGTELLGILGNHDERRALNTFGHRGLRAAVALTSFLSNIIMDFEGNAEGEGWKVYLDNIYVNWNNFEYAAHRSLERFYSEIYNMHSNVVGNGYLVWTNNNMVAAAMKFTQDDAWLGIFNFSNSNQSVSIQFDNPVLPIDDNGFYQVIDPLYSEITNTYNYYPGKELKTSRINSTVTYTDRVKFLHFKKITNIKEYYDKFIKDSFFRVYSISDTSKFESYYAYQQFVSNITSYETLEKFLVESIMPIFEDKEWHYFELTIKRIFYYIFKNKILTGSEIKNYLTLMYKSKNVQISLLGNALIKHNKKGAIVFMSAEAEPFFKSGGLANVVYELPRELVKNNEEVIVITGFYKNTDSKSVNKIFSASKKYNLKYSGLNVKFKIYDQEYEVGVYQAIVDGIKYYLFDHHELFDGLYWGITTAEKLKRRIGFARACAELICTANLKPYFTITNDAYTGLFNGIVRSDHVYYNNPNFKNTTYLHIIHNGGWQYFDTYDRYEHGFDYFKLFNLPHWTIDNFLDPVNSDKLNCMASGIRFADRNITVSPTYARQIECQCDGLENILNNVIGISNSIDKDFNMIIKKRFKKSGFIENNYKKLTRIIESNKKLKSKVEKRYSQILYGLDAIKKITNKNQKIIVNRVLNKMLLQVDRGLEVDPDKIIFCMIHRITEQKGFQLLLDASEGIFKQLGFQAIIGGSVSAGDSSGEQIAHGLWLLSQYYPESVNVKFGFQDISIPLLSTDIFCMPSLNEPGGISQIEALATGCLVVARATGGLRDTIIPIKRKNKKLEGNGFLFSDFTAWSFYDALERAMKFYESNSEEEINKLKNKISHSLSHWEKPTSEYVKNLYDLKEIIYT